MLIPDWPAPASVRAVFTTRDGGVSAGAYRGLNLGDHVGDAPQAVQRNRQLLSSHMGCEPVYLQQVHGWEHVALHSDSADGQQADVCSSQVSVRQGGKACCIMVADCVPVLLCNTQGTWVGAAHAGWRGLLGDGNGHGALEALVAAARQAQAGPCMAWIGPCIGPQAFEVGDEVRTAFVSQAQRCPALQAIAADVQAAFVRASPVDETPKTPKWKGNLPLLARARLQQLGVATIAGNDGSPAWCTVAQPERFFSHRRDGVSGRQAALVWLA